MADSTTSNIDPSGAEGRALKLIAEFKMGGMPQQNSLNLIADDLKDKPFIEALVKFNMVQELLTDISEKPDIQTRRVTTQLLAVLTKITDSAIKKLMENDGISTLTDSIKRESDDVCLKFELEAMCNALCKHMGIKGQFLAAGGVDILLELLGKEETGIKSKIAAAILLDPLMAGDMQLMSQVISKGGVGMLMDLVNHSDNDAINYGACALTNMLFDSDDAKKEVLQSPVFFDRLVEIIKDTNLGVEARCTAVSTLFTLCEDDQGSLSRTRAAGLTPSLLTLQETAQDEMWKIIINELLNKIG